MKRICTFVVVVLMMAYIPLGCNKSKKFNKSDEVQGGANKIPDTSGSSSNVPPSATKPSVMKRDFKIELDKLLLSEGFVKNEKRIGFYKKDKVPMSCVRAIIKKMGLSSLSRPRNSPVLITGEKPEVFYAYKYEESVRLIVKTHGQDIDNEGALVDVVVSDFRPGVPKRKLPVKVSNTKKKQN